MSDQFGSLIHIASRSPAKDLFMPFIYQLVEYNVTCLCQMCMFDKQEQDVI